MRFFSGAKANVRYTEYPEVGHKSWDKAYAEPEFVPSEALALRFEPSRPPFLINKYERPKIQKGERPNAVGDSPETFARAAPSPESPAQRFF